MWASAQNISGAGWSGMAEATSLDTMTQMNQAFRNIVNMLHGVVCGARRNRAIRRRPVTMRAVCGARRNRAIRRRPVTMRAVCGARRNRAIRRRPALLPGSSSPRCAGRIVARLGPIARLLLAPLRGPHRRQAGPYCPAPPRPAARAAALVPPLNGTFNPNGLIAKPGIVTALVPPLNGTFNPNGLIAKPGIVTALVPPLCRLRAVHRRVPRDSGWDAGAGAGCELYTGVFRATAGGMPVLVQVASCTPACSARAILVRPMRT